MADTKRELAHTLQVLMEEKPIDKIRVSEIAQRTGVSKQTFYRHFVDKYDLMQFCFSDMFANVISSIASNEPFEDCCQGLFIMSSKHQVFLHNAFESNDVNSLFKAMRYVLRDAFSERLALQGISDEGEIRFMADFYVKGLTGLTRRWLGQGMDIPRDELVRLTIMCLPEKLLPYFQ